MGEPTRQVKDDETFIEFTDEVHSYIDEDVSYLMSMYKWKDSQEEYNILEAMYSEFASHSDTAKKIEKEFKRRFDL